MIFTETGIQECEKWNNIVKSFKEYDTYYLCEYIKAFYLHGDGKPCLLFYDDGKNRAMNVVFVRDLADDKRFKGLVQRKHYFDLSTPYGYGGMIVEGDSDIVMEDYCDYCKQNGIISEVVRFHTIFDNWKKVDNFYNVEKIGDTVTLDLTSEQVIWENLSSKNRNMIRKALKSKVEVFWGRNPQLVDQFVELYNKTMDKDNASKYYYFEQTFYESILYDLKDSAMFFYAVYEGQMISCAIFLFDNKNMHYHLSASKKEFQHLAPTNLVLYEAAKWGACNGLERLHLGGGLGAAHDNLYRFKKAFYRKEDTEFYLGKKIFDIDNYEKLVDFRKQTDSSYDMETNFFPAYRG